MKTPYREHKKSDVQWQTDMQKERFRSIVAKALNISNDPERKKRHQENYCVCCYYAESRIGGAAMTKNQCGLCEKEMNWSSTCQEKLCNDCAAKHKLCKQCGCQVDLKEPRYIKTESFK